VGEAEAYPGFPSCVTCGKSPAFYRRKFSTLQNQSSDAFPRG
jgi:hypothetical protein